MTLPIHHFIHNLLLFAGSSAKIDTSGLYAFMAATGARVSELLHIKAEHIKVGYLDLYSKGGKIRRLYIPKNLRTEAEKWLKNQGMTSGYIFLNRFGQRITTRGNTTLHSHQL